MKLTSAVIAEKRDEYCQEEPLYTVEQEQIELLPTAFTKGNFTWKDADWVVRWYYRRFLGDYPDRERRRLEEQFDQNDFETIQDRIQAVVSTDTVEKQVTQLTSLTGVNVCVASAFLMFIDPDDYLVVGKREWEVLKTANELSKPYPGTVSKAEYVEYLRACRALSSRVDHDPWTLYRAIWRLATDREGQR